MDYTEIDKLIVLIQNIYEEICAKWNAFYLGKPVNLKKKLVRDIRDDGSIFSYILAHRAFLAELFSTEQFSLPHVPNRIKTQNSLESKINRYIDNKPEHGLSPINKCVNDLFGIRIICDGEIDFEDLQNHINCSYGLKCINAAKADYIATHICFKRDNYSFPWELQVWEKRYTDSNLISHHKYKQNYVLWENEAKGGET